MDSLTPELLQAVLSHARAVLPQECCGLLVRIDSLVCYWPARNIAERPERDFALHPDDWSAAEDAGDVLAVVHSHPVQPARPSMADRTGCERSGLPWLIVQSQTGAHVCISPCDYQAPLMGREYAYGVLDCWTLVRDWYAIERAVQLDPLAAPYGWWLQGEDLFRRHLGAQGFVELRAEEAQAGDVLLLQLGRHTVPSHLAILLDDGSILHHREDRLSGVDVYGEMWRRCTVGVAHYVGQRVTAAA